MWSEEGLNRRCWRGGAPAKWIFVPVIVKGTNPRLNSFKNTRPVQILNGTSLIDFRIIFQREFNFTSSFRYFLRGSFPTAAISLSSTSVLFAG